MRSQATTIYFCCCKLLGIQAGEGLNVRTRQEHKQRQEGGILNLKSHELQRSGQRDSTKPAASRAMELRAETATKASMCE